MLAEVYHLNLAQDSQALVQYERVADSFPRSEFAPKALYAVAWLKRNSLRSPDSLVAYQEVVKRFPRTVYAQEARKVLGQPLLPEDQIIRPKPRVDTAQARRAADSLAARVRSDSLARIGQLPEGESPKPPIAEREQGRGRDSGAGGTRRERGRERRERGLPGYEPEMRGRPAGPETGEPTTREPMPEEPGQRPEPELPRPEPPGPVPSEPATRELPGKPTPITARDSGAEGTPEPMRPEPEPPVGVPPEVVPPASESAPPAVEAETTATRTAPLDSASAARPPVRLASPARTVSADSALKPVFFDFDRATVRSSDTQALRTALLRLEADSSLGLLVTGYCDPLGAVDYNDALGRRRADAVRRWLIARGVAENRLDVLSFGSEAVTYTDPELYWYERRCEFRIVK
jgi:outer membrane protein OmpA-like peptidoglycan-associated protein